MLLPHLKLRSLPRRTPFLTYTPLLCSPPHFHLIPLAQSPSSPFPLTLYVHLSLSFNSFCTHPLILCISLPLCPPPLPSVSSSSLSPRHFPVCRHHLHVRRSFSSRSSAVRLAPLLFTLEGASRSLHYIILSRIFPPPLLLLHSSSSAFSYGRASFLLSFSFQLYAFFFLFCIFLSTFCLLCLRSFLSTYFHFSFSF